MATPKSPLPEHELCPYEKIRENIIQERENAMIESGFFDDLMNMKKDIGLIKDKDTKETDMDKGKKLGKHKQKVKDDDGKVKERRGKELSKKMMTKNVEDKIRKKDEPLNEEDLKGKQSLEISLSVYKNFHIDEGDLND